MSDQTASRTPERSAIRAALASLKRLLRASMRAAARIGLATAHDDRRLMVCVLLLEVAHADADLPEEERRYLESAVRAQFGLDASKARKLLERAERVRAPPLTLSQITAQIARSYSISQKCVLADIMWELVRSDGEIAGKEDYLVRKVCSRLGVASRDRPE